MLVKKNLQTCLYQDLLERLVLSNHTYRRLNQWLDLKNLIKSLESYYSQTKGTDSHPLESGLRALLLQFWNSLSDRQLSRYLQENVAAKWFCQFGLEQTVPDYSYFSRLRKKIGVERLTNFFNEVNQKLKEAGYIGGAFSFVDASSLIARVNVWEARDRAIADPKNEIISGDEQKKKTMNNQNLSNYVSDPEARFGCKGKNRFWLGYKRHCQVDMKQGMITQVAVTSAEVPDAKAFIEEDLCPETGMLFLDKGYDDQAVDQVIKEKGCSPATVRKKNHPQKEPFLDHWRNQVRMPFENTFARLDKKCRYRGKEKTLFQDCAKTIFETCSN